MPKPFVVPPAFPQPAWIGDLVLPQSPRLTAQMSSGHTSTLRVSKVQTGAAFSAEWYDLTDANLLAWQAFWREVDTWDVVTLPAGFWSSLMGTSLISCYTSSSPTGYWKMKIPKIERMGLINFWSMVIEFEGVID